MVVRMDNVITPTNKYLDKAEEIAGESHCIRRRFGAVIVKNNEIKSTGKSDVPVGLKTCHELGYCIRSKYNIPRGTRYELCRSVHAEQNAIINASPKDLKGSFLFLVGLENDGSYTSNPEPCVMCKRLIINAGISAVVCRISRNEYKLISVHDWVKNDKSMNLIDSYTKGGVK